MFELGLFIESIEHLERSRPGEVLARYDRIGSEASRRVRAAMASC